MRSLAENVSHLLQAGGQNKKVTIVTPRHVAAQALRSSLLTRQASLFSPEILSINGFIIHLCQLLEGAPRKISDQEAAAILRHLCHKRAGSLPPAMLQLFTSRKGSMPLLETCNELLEAGIAPDDLKQGVDTALQNLALVYEDFIQFCRQHRVGTLPILMQSILQAGGEEIKPLLPESLVFSSFYTLTPLLRKLMRFLSGQTTVTALIPWSEAHRDLFEGNDKLLAAGEPFECHHYLPWHVEDSGSPASQPLFSSSNQDAGLPVDAAFYSAPSRFDEVEHAAARIRTLLDDGVYPEEITLSMRSIGNYDQYIHAVFSRFGIPYAMRRGMPMLQSPLIKTISRCLSFGTQTVRFDSLLSMADSVFINLPDKEKLRERIIDTGIYEARCSQWSKYLRDRAAQDGADDAALRQAAAFIDDMSALAEEQSGYRSVFAFLKRWFVLPEENLDRQQHHLQQFKNLVEVVHRTEQFLRNTLGIESDEQPVQALQEAISEGNITPRRQLGGGVNVVNFFDAGYQQARHCLIIGMDEGSVPGKAGAGGGLLTDHMREMVNSTLPVENQLTYRSGRWRDEAQAFFLAVSSARDSLHVYYPRADDKGSEQLASPYLSELQSVCSSSGVTPLPGGDIRPFSMAAPDLYSLERQLLRREKQPGCAHDPVSSAAVAIFSSGTEGSDRLEHLFTKTDIELYRNRFLISSQGERPLPANAYTGKIEDEQLRQSILDDYLDETYAWSANSLELAMRSPFVFFINKLLNMRELVLPVREPEARLAGTYAHEVLARTLAAVLEQFPQPPEEAAISAFREACQAALKQELGLDDLADAPLPLQLALNRIHIQIEDVLRHEISLEGIRPVAVEHEFGGDTCFLEFGGQRMRFKGRFDRVDQLIGQDSEVLQIVDYKTGSAGRYKPSRTNAEEGKNVQMPIYMLFASRLHELDISQIRGRYISLLEPEENLAFSLQNKQSRSVPPLFDLQNSEKAVLPHMFAARDRLADCEFRPIGNFYDSERMIARWFELPPERTGGGGDE